MKRLNPIVWLLMLTLDESETSRFPAPDAVS
jgi:hypothetical protein